VLENVLVQLEHVRSLPAVRDALDRGLVTLHAWMYEIETGTIYSYDPEAEEFTPLLSQQDSLLAKK
jgi:carbonic anhydrase